MSTQVPVVDFIFSDKKIQGWFNGEKATSFHRTYIKMQDSGWLTINLNHEKLLLSFALYHFVDLYTCIEEKAKKVEYLSRGRNAIQQMIDEYQIAKEEYEGMEGFKESDPTSTVYYDAVDPDAPEVRYEIDRPDLENEHFVLVYMCFLGHITRDMMLIWQRNLGALLNEHIVELFALVVDLSDSRRVPDGFKDVVRGSVKACW